MFASGSKAVVAKGAELRDPVSARAAGCYRHGGCTVVDPSGPTPKPEYVRFVSVLPSTSTVLNAGSLVTAKARIFVE